MRNLPKKTDFIHLRITPELKTAAEQAAYDSGDTLSYWITSLIKRECAKYLAQSNTLPKRERR